VKRDRLHQDMMQSVLGASSTVMDDQKAGNNLLYLPLDKLMQQNGGAPAAADSSTVPRVSPTQEPVTPAATTDPTRTRDGLRSRDR
jgi:membrane protease subunit HflK